MDKNYLTTEELIEDLRKMGRGCDSKPNYYLEAADRLEDLTQDVEEWIAVFDMLNDRENRHGYLNWWREKNGKNDLCYPDGDEVYKDFFAMKSRAEAAETENERLKHILNCYAVQYGTVVDTREKDGD